MVNPLARRFLQPIDKTFAEVVRVRALGRASLYTDVAWAAARQYCALYNKSPSTVVKLVPFGNSFVDEGKGIFDDMCEPHSPPPPPPSAPFSGGQCPTNYDVTVTVSGYIMGSNGRENRTQTQAIIVTGDILNIFKRDIGALPGTGVPGSRQFQIVGYGKGSTNPVTLSGTPAGYQGFLVSGNDNFAYESHQTSVSRRDGQPDNCGSPAVSYPPPSATPDDLSSTTIINIAPGVNATVPVVIIPTIAPVVGIFRPPEFNVNVGGINVNISAGGFTFSPVVPIPVGNSSPYFDPRSIIPIPIPIDPSSSPSAPVDLTPVLDKVKELKDEVVECCDRLNPFEAVPSGKFIVTTLGSGNSGSFQLPARSFRVILTLTSDSGKLKQQAGDSSPTVFYAGWVWFEVDGGMMERKPIDALTKAYETPSRSTGKFAFKLYNDYTCTVSVRSSIKPT